MARGSRIAAQHFTRFYETPPSLFGSSRAHTQRHTHTRARARTQRHARSLSPCLSKEAQKECRSVVMGESSLEVHSCEDACTSTSQELSSEVSEPFNCSICLELVYKPIVQACGHIFCFWCAYQAMNVRRESHCPVCRRPYKYFPRVCELLHFALTKAVPEEYERRGQEIQRAEEQKQVFSPRFPESPRHTWSPRNLKDANGLNSQILSMTPRSGNTAIASNANAQAGNNDNFNVLECAIPAQNENAQRDTDCAKRDTSSMQSILTVDDFCCSFCHGLLYRPVVLNCGEVFCESCVKTSTSKVLCCPSCRAPHPAGSVLICLQLHQYLESAFPTEYLKRKLLQPAEKTQSSALSEGNTTDTGDCKIGRLHQGVGCDGCGMFPIEGDRYRCAECTEKIGFDLCGSCYNNGGSRLGRFNQEHRPNHRMEQVQSGLSHLLVFNMLNSSIQRRRQQQQTVNDLDDYIDSFVG